MKKNLILIALFFVILFIWWCSMTEKNDNFSKKVDCTNIFFNYYENRIKEENEYEKEAREYRMVDFDLTRIFTTKFYYNWDYSNQRSITSSFLLPLWFFYSPTRNTCVLEIQLNSRGIDGISESHYLWDMLLDDKILWYQEYYDFENNSWWIDKFWTYSTFEKCKDFLKWNISEDRCI